MDALGYGDGDLGVAVSEDQTGCRDAVDHVDQHQPRYSPIQADGPEQAEQGDENDLAGDEHADHR
jgi:hypothetical protein